MFQVIPDGRLVAYTADKGDKVLDIQTGLRGGMGPPITYMLDGKQYVALAGGSGALPAFGPPAGSCWRGRPGSRALLQPPLAHRSRGRCGGSGGTSGRPPQVTPKLLVFVLDGKAQLPARRSPGAVGYPPVRLMWSPTCF